MQHDTATLAAPVNELPEQSNESQNGSIRKVKIPDYAFIQAGLHKGDAKSLTAHLGWIKEGHIVDEGYSEQQHLLGKKKAEGNIQQKETDKVKLESDEQTLNEIKIPAAKALVEETQIEIRQVKIDNAEKRIRSDFQPVRYYTYVTLVILLTVYLIFFYASAIHSAFFRNAASLIKNAGNDILLYIDNIFDPQAIFSLDLSLVFTYFGAFLFFSIGLLPHAVLNGETKNKSLKAGLLIAGAFLADAALAYKIDKGIHDLKLLAGIADADWKFYTSINFYLVLLFGFCAYLVWGQMFEFMLKEKSKKNTDFKTEIIVADLKNKLNEQKQELQLLQVKVKELGAQIAIILKELEKLKKDLETAMANPDELARNLTSFYKGWRQYLLGSSELESERAECETAYAQFMDNLFIKIPQSLN